MANKPSKTLFNLVKTLGQTEIRYLRMHLTMHSGERNNKHLRLFDLILNQKEFDEHHIKLSLYNNKSVKSNTFSEVKKYLYHFILKTLISYDEVNSLELRIKTGLQKIRVLYKRGLIKDCKNLINSLQKPILEANDSSALLELYKWHKKLAYKTMDIEYLIEKSSELDASAEKLIKEIKSVYDLEKIFYELFVKRVQFSDRISEDQKIGIDHLIKTIPETVDSFEEKRWHYKILSYYYLLINDIQNYYKTTKDLYAHIKSNPFEIKEFPGEISSLIDQVIFACNLLGYFEEAASYIPDFRPLINSKSIGVNDKSRAICSYHLNILINLTYLGRFKEGVVKIEEFLNKYPLVTYELYLINFSMIFLEIYFGNGNFEKALEWADKLFDLKAAQRKDIQAMIRTSILLIHFELKNYELVDSLCRSTSRYIKKDFEIENYEREFMKLLKIIMNPVLNRKDYQEALINYKSTTDNEKLYIIESWVESKLQKKTISMIYYERSINMNK